MHRSLDDARSILGEWVTEGTFLTCSLVVERMCLVTCIVGSLRLATNGIEVALLHEDQALAHILLDLDTVQSFDFADGAAATALSDIPLERRLHVICALTMTWSPTKRCVIAQLPNPS